MKEIKHPSYLINPQDIGYVIDFYEAGKNKKSAHNTRKNTVQFILNKIPSNHQILITDMGEVK